LPVAEHFDLKRGDEVLTLGYPSPSLQGIQQKATFGKINASTGLGDDHRFVQVDVPIQPGNSGGPLLNNQGAVVGVTTLRLTGNF
jgi:S1-C subfamily serine protease